ncbi:uncharacterized protein TNCV_3280291 [Trichonephila clavipes]|nr:uncharacterized protein TNCV_3280291 [Trichonephila clavipes]
MTFHIDLAWHHCRRSCRCSGVKGSAWKGRLDLRVVGMDSIQNAAKEAICENEGNKNIAVAVDGTWQKHGYIFLNGVVTVTSIDAGKVIDVDILSKYCACKILPFHEKDCKRNYVGSSGAMEIKVRLKFSTVIIFT